MPRWTSLRRSPLRPAVVLLLILGAVVASWRLVTVGLLGSTGQVVLGVSWFGEQLSPLAAVAEGLPVERIDARQYGPAALLLIDAPFRLSGGDIRLVEVAVLVLGIVSIVVAFVVLAVGFQIRGIHLVVRAIAWMMFVPLLHALAARQVDLWVLGLISTAAVLFVHPLRAVSNATAIPLVLAALTKLVPGALVAFVSFRDLRAAAVAALMTLAVLAAGHFAYGPLLGAAYPVEILRRLPENASQWSTHHENNSLRGLAFKVAGGFDVVLREDGESTGSVRGAAPAVASGLQVLTGFMALALVAYAGRAALRGRRMDSPHRRAIEFGLAAVTMLLISPHTSHEALVVTLVPFTIAEWLHREHHVGTWPRSIQLATLGSLALIGVFVPVTLLAPVLAPLLDLSSNQSFAPNIGAYDLLGFPGLGLILLWYVFARLEGASYRGGSWVQRPTINTTVVH